MKLRSLTLALLVGAGASFALTPVATHGALSVKNAHIVDANGKNTTLRGVSMFWSSEPDGYKFWTPGTMAWLQSDWNTMVVRLPMGIEHVADAPSINLSYLEDSAKNAGRVINMVDVCVKLGLYVVVDWHAHQLHQDEAVRFFTTMAAKYKNTPNIIWEVFNEPNGPGNDQVSSYANAVIAAIRKNSNNLILVGSANWSSQPDQIPAVTDAKGNVAYTLHFYAGEGAHDGYRSSITSAMSKGRAVFVSEWGMTSADGASNLSTGNSQTWMDFLETNGVSSCAWAVSNQLKDPNNVQSTIVQASAALQRGAAATGNWAASDLAGTGTWVRSYLRSKNSAYTPPPAAPDTTYIGGTTDTLWATASFAATGITTGTSSEGSGEMITSADGATVSYTVNSRLSGYLKPTARIKGGSSAGQVTYAIDGVTCGVQDIPANSGWTALTDTFLTQNNSGVHTLKLTFKGVNSLRYLTFTKMPLGWKPTTGIARRNLSGLVAVRREGSLVSLDLPEAHDWTSARLIDAQGKVLAQQQIATGAKVLRLDAPQGMGWIVLDGGIAPATITLHPVSR